MGILSIWILAVAIAMAFNKRVEDTAVLGIALISTIFMICGAAGWLQFGVSIAVALTAGAAIYIAYRFIVDKKDRLLVFSIGSMAIMALIVLFAVTNMGRGISHADDVAYWGRVIKTLYNFSDIHFNEGSVKSIHPLGILVWDYYVLKTWVGYTESFPLMFHALLNTLLLLPLLKYAEGRYRYIKALAIIIFILIVPLPIRGAYGTLYADIILALYFAYIMMALVDYIETTDKIYLVQILAGLYLTVSTKRIGIINVACSLAIVAFGLLISSKKADESAHRYKWLAVLAVVPGICSLIWDGDIKAILLLIASALAGALLAVLFSKGFFVKHKTFCVYFVFALMVGFGIAIKQFSKTDDYWKTLVNNYIDYSFNQKYFLGVGIIPFLAIVSLVIYMIYRKTTQLENDKPFLAVSIMLVMTMVAYLAGFLIIYIVSIAKANGANGAYLPSFNRYMAVIYYSVFFLMIKIVFLKFWNKRGIVIALLVFSMVFYADDFLSFAMNCREQVRFYGFDQAGVELDQNSTVLYIDEDPIDIRGVDWFYCFEYEYYLAKCIDSTLYVDGENGYISAQELEDKLCDNGVDYIYIQTVNEDFVEKYGSIIPELGNFRSGMVYKVEEESENKIILIN